MGTAPANTPPIVKWEQRFGAERAALEQARRQLFYSVPNPENEVSPNAEVEKKDFLP